MADVVYLVRDLLFTSKIRETCTQLGRAAKSAPNATELVDAARSARLVILDLRTADALTALDLLRSDPETRAIPAVGFVDHERVEVMDSARAHGCQEVLAKGQFSTRLPQLIAALSTDPR